MSIITHILVDISAGSAWELACSQQARQRDRVAAVVLDPVSGLSGRQRGRADAADKSQAGDLALNVVAARPGFVDKLHCPVQTAEATRQLRDRFRGVLDSADMADFALSSRIGDRDGDRRLVDVEADERMSLSNDLPSLAGRFYRHRAGCDPGGQKGHVIWPTPADGVVAVSAAQLGYLLEGIDWRNPRQTWRPSSAI